MRLGAAAVNVRGVFLLCAITLVSACTSPISIGPPAAEATTTASAEPVTVTPEEPTPTETAVPPTPTVVVEPTPVPTVQCTVQAVRGLRLRAGPGTEFAIVTTLNARDELSAQGKTTEGDWIAVTTASGAQGWVSSNFVDCGDGIPQLPVATASSAP